MVIDIDIQTHTYKMSAKKLYIIIYYIFLNIIIIYTYIQNLIKIRMFNL